MPWPPRLIWTWLACAISLWAFSLLGIVVTVSALVRGEWSTAAGIAGVAVVFACLGWIGFGAGGVQEIRLSRRIVECTDLHGHGIRIPTRRGGALVLAAALGGAGLYGLVAATVHYLGDSTSLLPGGRNTDSNAALMGILGVVVLLIALWVVALRPRGEVRIYPSGIRRIVHRPFPLRSRAVGIYRDWSDIETVIADEMVIHSGGVDVHHPMIKIRTFTPINPELRTKFDSEHELTLLVKMYVVEPNTLFKLLRYLDENPGSRPLVGAPVARELLRPPALSARLEVGRS